MGYEINDLAISKLKINARSEVEHLADTCVRFARVVKSYRVNAIK